MRLSGATRGALGSRGLTRNAVLAFVLGTLFSGCTVLSDSAEFYKDRRPGPINWRQYTSD